MFLSSDSKILLWKRIAWAAIVVVALVFIGIFWLDIPLYKLMRHLDGLAWGVVERATDVKVWLVLSFAICAIFSGTVIFKKIFDKNDDKSNNKNASVSSQNKFVQILNGFAEKTGASAIIFTNDFKNKKWFEKIASASFAVFVSVAASGAIVWVLKGVIGRARPIIFDFWGRTGFAHWTFGNDYYDSMPSGHATANFAGLVILGMLFPKIKPWTWTLAIIIALSRVAHGAHFPSDILFGAFVGMLVADIVVYVTNKGIRHRA